MKFLKIYINHIIIIGILFSIGNVELSAQGTDIQNSKRNTFFIGLSLIPNQSYVNVKGGAVLDSLHTKEALSFSGLIDATFFFNNYLGLSSGIGYNPYKINFQLDSYLSSYVDTDADSDKFEMNVLGSNISEELTLNLINIPLCLSIRLPAGNNVGFFLAPGLNFNIPVKKVYESHGTFTYKGYYPDYNVLLEGLPDYGFPSDNYANSEGSIEVKPFFLCANIAAGIDILNQKKIQLSLSAFYERSISSVLNYTSTDLFQLSPKVGEMNSLMGGYSDAILQKYGIRFSVRFLIN